MIRDLSKKDLEKANGGLSTILNLRFPAEDKLKVSDVSDSQARISAVMLNSDSTAPSSPFLGNEEISNIVQEEAYRERYVPTDRIIRPHTFRSKFLKRN